jgi:hypothetical protein
LQIKHVSGFDLLGRLVKSIPIIFIYMASILAVLRQFYSVTSRHCLNNLISPT